jgi:hypothetical protein
MTGFNGRRVQISVYTDKPLTDGQAQRLVRAFRDRDPVQLHTVGLEPFNLANGWVVAIETSTNDVVRQEPTAGRRGRPRKAR